MATTPTGPSNWGDAEPIRQNIHDLVHTIGTHLGLIPADNAPSTDHDKAVQQMNNQLNAHKNDAANASFKKQPQLSDDQAAKIRAKVKGK